jgi:hypothetical protein
MRQKRATFEAKEGDFVGARQVHMGTAVQIHRGTGVQVASRGTGMSRAHVRREKARGRAQTLHSFKGTTIACLTVSMYTWVQV